MHVSLTERAVASNSDMRLAGDTAPALAAPWLVLLRYGLIVGLALLILLVTFGANIRLPLAWLAVPISAMLLSNLLLPRMIAGLGGRRAMGATLLLDVLALTMFLSLTGGTVTGAINLNTTVGGQFLTLTNTNPNTDIVMSFTNNANSYGYLGIGGTNDGGYYANNMFLQATNSIIFNTGGYTSANVPRMIMLANGNVGIGSAIPASTLDVNGTITSTGSIINGTMTINGSLSVPNITLGSGGKINSYDDYHYIQINQPTNTLTIQEYGTISFNIGITKTQMALINGSGMTVNGNTTSSTLTINGNTTSSFTNSTTPTYSLDISQGFYKCPLLCIDAGVYGGNGTQNPRAVGQPLMKLGKSAWSGAGDYYGMGFGYSIGITDCCACEIGCMITNSLSGEVGDLIFSTRSSTTPSTPATERMRITSSGAISTPTFSTSSYNNIVMKTMTIPPYTLNGSPYGNTAWYIDIHDYVTQDSWPYLFLNIRCSGHFWWMGRIIITNSNSISNYADMGTNIQLGFATSNGRYQIQVSSPDANYNANIFVKIFDQYR